MRTKPSRTAQYVAQTRALMTNKGVLDDPYASSMLTLSNRVVTRALSSSPLARVATSPFFAALSARIAFFDHAVRDALDAGVNQVVILGAGYDARAWRMARAGATFFEVDHPATQADKRRRAPAGGPVYVPVDFRTDDLAAALNSAAFEWTGPALFVIEGVTMYLTEAAVRDLLSLLSTRAAPGSRLAVNFAAPPGTGGRRDRMRQALLRRVGSASGEPHVFSLPVADAQDFVAACGWQTVNARSLRDLAPELLGPTSLRIDGINPHAAVVSAAQQS